MYSHTKNIPSSFFFFCLGISLIKILFFLLFWSRKKENRFKIRLIFLWQFSKRCLDVAQGIRKYEAAREDRTQYSVTELGRQACEPLYHVEAYKKYSFYDEIIKCKILSLYISFFYADKIQFKYALRRDCLENSCVWSSKHWVGTKRNF